MSTLSPWVAVIVPTEKADAPLTRVALIRKFSVLWLPHPTRTAALAAAATATARARFIGLRPLVVPPSAALSFERPPPSFARRRSFTAREASGPLSPGV